MIQNTELRRGNKVLNLDNVIDTVIELRDEYYLNEAGHGSLYKTSTGIPLSPEILEKCEGFIKQVGTPNNSKAIYFDFVGYRIYCTDAFCSIHFDAGDWFPEIRKINNLHTFQNWYYFNTGHELTCKP